MNEIGIVIWILTISILVCLGTICFMICIIAKLNRMVDIRDKSIEILGKTAEEDFKAVVKWQSKYIDVKEEYNKLQKDYDHLKGKHEDLHIYYDVAYMEYEYCRHERDDFKKRLEKYEHNVI